VKGARSWRQGERCREPPNLALTTGASADWCPLEVEKAPDRVFVHFSDPPEPFLSNEISQYTQRTRKSDHVNPKIGNPYTTGTYEVCDMTAWLANEP